MEDKKSPIFLITGLILGILVGLGYAWLASPVDKINTHPNSLQIDFQDTYREQIALAYLANGDIGRAKARLSLLNDPDPSRTLSILAQRRLGQPGKEELARALGLLSAALSADSLGTPVGNFTAPTETVQVDASADTSVNATEPVSETNSPASTPTLTSTALPTRTATATQGAAFVAEDLFLVCDPALITPIIQIYVFDASGRSVPGIQIIVTWEGGQDSFVTGLKPEFGLGYADFEMSLGIFYTVQIADNSEAVQNITPGECEDENGEPYLGSWRVTFNQP